MKNITDQSKDTIRIVCTTEQALDACRKLYARLPNIILDKSQYNIVNVVGHTLFEFDYNYQHISISIASKGSVCTTLMVDIDNENTRFFRKLYEFYNFFNRRYIYPLETWDRHTIEFESEIPFDQLAKFWPSYWVRLADTCNYTNASRFYNNGAMVMFGDFGGTTIKITLKDDIFTLEIGNNIYEDVKLEEVLEITYSHPTVRQRFLDLRMQAKH